MVRKSSIFKDTHEMSGLFMKLLEESQETTICNTSWSGKILCISDMKSKKYLHFQEIW